MNITIEERWAIDTVISNARARALATESNFLDGQIDIASSCIERMIAEQPEPAKPFDVEALERVIKDVSGDLGVALASDYATDEAGFGDLIAGAYNKVNFVLDKIAELKGKS
jgi:hypothetical protein